MQVNSLDVWIYSIAIQKDGKILAAGNIVNNPSYYDFALNRFNSDGSLDAGFGTNGKVTTDIGQEGSDEANDIAIQKDGKIILAGSSPNGFALVRYNIDGSPDNTFGNNGLVTQEVSRGDDGAYTIAIQSDGKVISGGASKNDNAINVNMFALIRLWP